MGEITSVLSIFNNYRLEYKSHTYLVGHYLNLLKFLGIGQPSEEKEVFIKPEEEKKALDFLTQNNLNTDDLLIGISPVPGNKIKQWDLSKFASLADLLAEKLGSKIIFTGSADDSVQIKEVQRMMRNGSVNGSGLFKLYELPALLKMMKLFISVDSGPLYIANALKVPVVDIGGCYDIREQTPSGSGCRVLQKNTNSSLAYSTVVSPSSECRNWFSRQLQEITTEEVFEAAKFLLS
ncbi:MAG: glycosyltransferase family 9 protein [Candidatus Omnitrophica bacterium]|nr:glycosyltransferase family 9 protein [Candidatus Omnitrophota bacterium]